MENALTGIIIIGIMILAMLGLTEGSLTAQGGLAEATRLMQVRLADQARTHLQALSASTSVLGDMVYITVTNTGNTKLADFEHWDVIVEYTDLSLLPHANWYTYGTWLRQIYQTAPTTLEKIEPNILNPGEEMIITVPVEFTIAAGSTNVATVATPNGIAASVIFER
ncbi:MAG: hypothetical protein HY870_10900 [Chloroflexi bacterium]|nr:hypothetical protein [Chloroflexota bacterium]